AALFGNLLDSDDARKSLVKATIHGSVPLPATFLTHPTLMNVPPEIFANICEYLEPPELFALSSTCRKYHDYLCSEESGVTQQIWKNSRIMFLPLLTEPPLEGMDQRRYTALLILQRTCQICGKTQYEKPVPFQLDLAKEKMPRQILAAVPHMTASPHMPSTSYMLRVEDTRCSKTYVSTINTKIHVLNRLHVYWRPDIIKLVKKCQAMKPKDRQAWLQQQSTEMTSKMQDFQRRRTAYSQEILRKAEETRQNRLARALESLKNELNFDGTPRFHTPMFDYCTAREQPLQFFVFTDKDWARWRNRMEFEYRKMMERANSFKPIMYLHS
ncbi:11962_t:CDS:2, partial [Ambispora gerdemannii]